MQSGSEPAQSAIPRYLPRLALQRVILCDLQALFSIDNWECISVKAGRALWYYNSLKSGINPDNVSFEHF